MVSEILNNPDKIMQSIVDQKGMTMDELHDLVSKKIDKYGGLLTEAGAAYSIARELGVQTGFEPKPSKINELKSGQINVRLKAVIRQLYPINTFNSRNRQGTVQNIFLEDDTGTIKFVVWNKQLDFKQNQQVAIEGAYVKDNSSMLELHAGNNCKINLGEVIFPVTTPVDSDFTSLSKLQENKIVAVKAIVDMVYPAKDFKKKEGIGKLRSMTIKENGDLVRAVFWDDKASLIDSVSSGNIVCLYNFKVRNNNDELELHTTFNSKIEAKVS